MKRLSLCLIFLIALESLCVAEVTKLPAEHRKVLEDSSRFREELSKTNLPSSIVSLCADGGGRLAEPGKKWQASDVITDKSLPRNRLIWAAVAGEYYVVHYERGGFVHNYLVLVATLAKGETKPKIVWRGLGIPLRNYSEFLDALRKGKLMDSNDMIHDPLRSAEEGIRFLESHPPWGNSFELLISDSFTFAGKADTTGAGMAVLLDKILGFGYEPDGFEQKSGFKSYRYKKMQ
jgi:hypothetical protein